MAVGRCCSDVCAPIKNYYTSNKRTSGKILVSTALPATLLLIIGGIGTMIAFVVTKNPMLKKACYGIVFSSSGIMALGTFTSLGFMLKEDYDADKKKKLEEQNLTTTRV